MTVNSPARQHFQELLRQPEAQLNLAEAALCIAWEDQNNRAALDWLGELDSLAATVRPRMRDATRSEHVVILNRFLFDELQFHGNTLAYNDPVNSFLNEVLRRRTGLPITLSVVYLELAWRLGLPMVGLALPGHFVVRYPDASGDIMVDPFNQGRLMTSADCEQQVASVYGSASSTLLDQIMRPPTKLEILARMLRNLKATYVERGEFGRALSVVERVLLVYRDDPGELRDRGLLRARVGQFSGALEDFDQYARLRPFAADLQTIKQQARTIGAYLAARN
jgi:regulator of sirC expression with transglutaminase-like and TPR domain